MKVMRLSIAASLALVAGCLTGSVEAQQANMTFFITSAGPGNGGDLGGFDGADAHCQKLATAAGAGNRKWRAYLSSNQAMKGGVVNARDRIGKGPWQNAKGVVVATSVEDLHSANNKLSKQNSLNEKGEVVSGRGDKPNQHDVMTGSQMDGTAFPGNLNVTCANWTSSTFGSALVGHHDREGNVDTIYMKSWNSSHMSRSCSQPDLIATGGNGLFYCFAQ